MNTDNLINTISNKLEKELDNNIITGFSNELKKCEENIR